MSRRRADVLDPIERTLEGLGPLAAAERVARPDAAFDALLAATGADRARLVIDAFERRACDRAERRARGVFYTPPAIVDAMLDRVPLEGVILDPAAGAGAFVVALARRLGPDALDRVHACDLDPVALDACTLALEVALGPGARNRLARWRATNAHVADFLRDSPVLPPPALIVGNPPYGHSTEPDLPTRFPSVGGESDLYACFLVRAMERVGAGGTVALLVPDTWVTNTRAAALRAHVLERSGLAAFVDFGKPFATAPDTRVHAVVLRAGAGATRVESDRGAGLEPMGDAPRAELVAGAPAGWRLYRTTAERRACAVLERGSRRLGDLFDVIYGLRTGSNATHVRREAGSVPLVGGEDFDAFDRRWRPKSLVNPATFSRLVARQRGRWKVGIQRIRTNSRVPWRRWVEAAPLRPEEVGLDSLTLLAAPHPPSGPEAALPEPLLGLLGVLNSSVLNRWYRLTYTDVNVKPAYLSELPVPELQPSLARLVRRRLGAPGDLALERQIDRLVADAYGLAPRELEVLEAAFWGEERADRPLPPLEEAQAAAEETDVRGVAAGG